MKYSNVLYKGLLNLKVLKVKHWTSKTFSFSLERLNSPRFRSREFVIIGRNNGDKPLQRAYSIASPSWEDELEFYSIKVQAGRSTSRLQYVKIGHEILLKPKLIGTLVLYALLPGKRLVLFSTGTSIVPFASVARDPETYEKFEEVILTQTCREVGELDLAKMLLSDIKYDELLSEIVGTNLSLISTTTRKNSQFMGRLTDWLEDGRFKSYTGDALNVHWDRVMICGSMDMLKSHKDICEGIGMREGSNTEPGHFVIEKAFVD